MRNIKSLLLLPLILFSGCMEYVALEPNPHNYYLNSAKNLKQIGRVTLVELTNNSSVHQISSNVTESLFQEIEKKQIFGLTKVWQDDPIWRSLQLDNGMRYTLEEIAQIQKALKSDAILVGTITRFEPYPHLAIGLRLQLIDLSDGQLIWALEQIWDATDKTTRDRIEAYYNPKRLLLNDENLSGQLGSVSSIKFFKFVSYEITQTLDVNS